MFGFFEDDYGDTFNIASVAANDFIRLSLDNDKPITNNKLHMLMFVANGWYLAVNNEPMIDENFIATSRGPVIPSVYKFLSKYGNDPISGSILTWIYGRDGKKYIIALSYGVRRSGEEQVIKQVWKQYADVPEEELMDKMLVCKNHPYTYIWQVKSNFGRYDTVIPNDLIADYFRPILMSNVPTKV